jgi:hypothetical protein
MRKKHSRVLPDKLIYNTNIGTCISKTFPFTNL